MNNERGRDIDVFVIFPVERYLSDVALQKAVVELTRSGDLKSTSEKIILFRPLSADALKQKRDWDIYSLTGTHGRLVRTHTVIADGLARMNPPPKGFTCDSCHRKGWLRKDFQDSKIDGANIAVWLCPECTKLKPEERNVRF